MLAQQLTVVRSQQPHLSVNPGVQRRSRQYNSLFGEHDEACREVLDCRAAPDNAGLRPLFQPEQHFPVGSQFLELSAEC